jgi:hypothetical protein
VEVVTASVTAGGSPVSIGSVTINDAGQQQTVPVSNGSATATFHFNLFQESGAVQAHAINASYNDGAGGTIFSSSTGSAQSGHNAFPFLFQLLLDFSFLQALGL